MMIMKKKIKQRRGTGNAKGRGGREECSRDRNIVSHKS